MPGAPVADVLISHQGTLFVQGFYAYKISILGKSKKVAGAIITVSRRKGFFLIQNLNTSKKKLHGTKLSFIQLGGGIAMGVQQKQTKYYSLTDISEMLVHRDIGLVVRTTTPQILFPVYLLMKITSAAVEFWKCLLRYHYCRLHDLLCELPTHCLLGFHSLFTIGSFRNMTPP